MARRSGNILFLWIFKNSFGFLGPLLLAATVVTICELSIPWILEQVIDEAISDDVDMSIVNLFGLLMLGIIVLLYLVHHVYLRYEIKLVCNTSFQIYRQFYSHILAQPLSYFKRKRSGEILHRVMNDTAEFEQNARYLLSDLPYEIMIVVGTLIMMIFLDPWLAFFVFIFLVATSIVSTKIGRPLPVLERRVQMLGARFSNRLQEIINGIRTVKTFGNEMFEQQTLDAANRKRADIQQTSGKIEAWLLPLFELMETLGVILVVWYGAHLIFQDKLTPGGLVAFIAYMEILAVPVSRAGKYYRHWLEASAMADRIVDFLRDTDDKENLSSISWEHPNQHMIKTIQFDNVSFTYPRTEGPVLHDIQFSVQQGEIVSLVGRNGSGKSTTMDLLQGFYLPDTGKILADGQNIHDMEISLWRQRVGVMSQEVFLFNTSIRDNILYGVKNASEAQLMLACHHAGLTSLIQSLPKGLNTRVGEKGGRFSGGQRQRIALARLYLINPAVIIYDEPTAALDGEAAKDVALRIRRFGRDRISIVIAHQAEMVAVADRIILLDKGRIHAQGSHDELFQNELLYRRLFASIEHREEFEQLSREFSSSGIFTQSHLKNLTETS
ncbi:MAG: ABC transporter ATP-binding protein/permease [Gammaproteobacteria bacterium]|nr:ABC transporter ATP-binding protein/permease [Gammaproteobacteria bacterium]